MDSGASSHIYDMISYVPAVSSVMVLDHMVLDLVLTRSSLLVEPQLLQVKDKKIVLPVTKIVFVEDHISSNVDL